MFEKLKKMFKKNKPFDWNDVPAPDPDAVNNWLAATDTLDRQFPLQLALQVHDVLEKKLLVDARLDSLQLAEIRGGLRALKTFAGYYTKTIRLAVTEDA